MSPSTGRIDGSQANTTCSAAVRLIETISRKPSASTTPNESTRLRSHHQGPHSCLASLRTVKLTHLRPRATHQAPAPQRTHLPHTHANPPPTHPRPPRDTTDAPRRPPPPP